MVVLLDSQMASRLLWASRAASYLRIQVTHRGFASGKLIQTYRFPLFLDHFSFIDLLYVFHNDPLER